jgi:hypothetical protein
MNKYCHAISSDQTSSDACAHNTLKHASEDVAVAEALIARTRTGTDRCSLASTTIRLASQWRKEIDPQALSRADEEVSWQLDDAASEWSAPSPRSSCRHPIWRPNEPEQCEDQRFLPALTTI